MAQRPTFQRPEEDDADNVQHLGGLDGGVSGPSQGASSFSTAPAQTQAPAQKAGGSATDRFVSFDRLLDANAGNAQHAADNVANTVTGKVNAATDAQNSFLNSAQQEVNNGVSGERWLSLADDGTYYVAGGKPFSYSGPTNVNEATGYGDVANAFAGARSAVNSLGNRRDGGINALMGTSPGTGNGRLSGALVNAKGGSRFDQLFQNWTTGDNSLNNKELGGVKAFDNMVTGGRNAATERENALQQEADFRTKVPGYNYETGGGGSLGSPRSNPISTGDTIPKPPPKPKHKDPISDSIRWFFSGGKR